MKRQLNEQSMFCGVLVLVIQRMVLIGAYT